MMTYYKGLIALRKQLQGQARVQELSGGALAVRIGEHAVVLINPTDTNLTYSLEGTWKLVADGNTAGTEALAEATGSVTVEPGTVHIYVR